MMNTSQSIYMKIFRPNRKIIVSFFPLLFGSEDSDDVPAQTPTDIMIEERYKAFKMSNEMSGWERVKFGLFTPDDVGEFGPHVSMITTSTGVAALTGFIIGSFEKSKKAYLDFVRTNQATKFDSHMEAKRRLQDRVSLGYIKGGAQLGWRTGLFMFMFMSVSNAVSLYRNTDGIIEYTAGGLAAGISYRAHIGVRAVIVGGILGTTFGTIAGLFNYSYMKIFGLSMAQVREANYKFHLYRESWMNEETAEVNREDGEDSMLMDKLASDKKSNTHLDKLEKISSSS